MSGWQPIATADMDAPFAPVDLWMNVHASPRSFGMADAFRVPDAYSRAGKWYHHYRGAEAELQADYITHWMPVPKPPVGP